MTFRAECVKGWAKDGTHPSLEECPPTFRTIHEDYYISRLESPWACGEEGSTLETIPINIVNVKDGNTLGVNTETGAIEVSADNTIWTFRPACEGGVELTNTGTGATITWSHDPDQMTFMDKETELFAMSTKRKGLQWMPLQYLADKPNSPWERYQWQVKRAL